MLSTWKLGLLLAFALTCVGSVSAQTLAAPKSFSKDPMVQEFVTIGSMIQKYAQLPRCYGQYQTWHECVLYTYFVNTDHIRSSTIFEHGKPNGEYRSFFFSGLPLEEKHFVNGVENGQRVSYSSAGRVIARVPYVGGKKEGIAYKYYSYDGTLKSEISYKNDYRDGITKEYYENGKLSQISHYRQGELHGRFELFFPNGNKNVEDYYEYGLQTGPAYKYSEKGHLVLLEHYFKGKRHGVTRVYQPNHDVLFSVVFDQDEAIFGKCGKFGADGRDLSFKELVTFAKGRGYPNCSPLHTPVQNVL